MARKISVEIIGDASSLQRAFKQSEHSAGGFGSTLGKVGKTAGLVAGGAALGGLAVVLKKGADEFMDSQRVTAQTNAVLKSTGGVANVTAKEVDNLANSILAKTGIDDETVKSGENMLLTFRNIRNEVGKGNDIFTQSTHVLADMSVALGKDMPKTAIQLGKALNDPVKGITALSRAGVQFTAAQKDQIKAMVAAGDTMKAQKLILGELNKEFGGSAEAAGKTLPGQLNILKESFNNMAGELVSVLMPSLMSLTQWITAHMPEIQKVLETVFDAIGTAVRTAADLISTYLVPAAKEAVQWFKQNWPEISRIAGEVFAKLQAAWKALKPTVENIATLLKNIASVVIVNWPKIQPIVEAFAKVIEDSMKIVGDALRLITDLLTGKWGDAWRDAKKLVSDIFGGIKDLFVAETLPIRTAAVALGKAIKEGIVAGVTGLKNLIVDLVKGALNAVIGLWNALRIPGFSLDIDLPGPVPDIHFNWDGFNIPDIPYLDMGGQIARTGLAVVHKGETVIPSGGGSGMTVNVYVSGSVTAERDLAQTIRTELLKVGRRNGTIWGQYA